MMAPCCCIVSYCLLAVTEDSDAKPIFGVSLALAVERSPCHDGIQLPVVVRQCIDYIEEFGNSFFFNSVVLILVGSYVNSYFSAF